MATKVEMPQMGESVVEGTILTWLKAEGDDVAVDDPLVEVSTDKVDTEVPAPATGVLTAIYVQPDETVPTGTVLGEIDVSGNGGVPARVFTCADQDIMLVVGNDSQFEKCCGVLGHPELTHYVPIVATVLVGAYLPARRASPVGGGPPTRPRAGSAPRRAAR